MSNNSKIPYHGLMGDAEFLAETSLISFISENKELVERFRKPNIKISDTNSSYRTINHWESLNILNDNRESKGWRKFSTFDVLWIEIVKHLRKWNIKTDVILEVKSRLFEDIGLERDFLDNREDKKLDILWMEKAFFQTIISKDYNMYLIIYEDGESYITTQSEINKNMMFGIIPEGYLLINLNGLWSRVISKIQVNNENQFSLDKNEKKIVHSLKTEKCDLNIKKSKDGKVEYIEKTVKGTNEELGGLSSAVDGVNYGKFTGSIQDGKTVFMEVISKEKVKK